MTHTYLDLYKLSETVSLVCAKCGTPIKAYAKGGHCALRVEPCEICFNHSEDEYSQSIDDFYSEMNHLEDQLIDAREDLIDLKEEYKKLQDDYLELEEKQNEKHSG